MSEERIAEIHQLSQDPNLIQRLCGALGNKFVASPNITFILSSSDFWSRRREARTSLSIVWRHSQTAAARSESRKAACRD